MARKSIWDTPPGSSPAASDVVQPWGGISSAETTQAEPPPTTAPLSVIEQLRVAEAKQRNRGWEKQTDNRPTSFRGVPPTLQAEVKQVALELQVTVDDVARAFLEFGWQCQRKSELVIAPSLSRQRLTLFPEPGDWASVPRPGWYERIWDTPMAKTSNGGKRTHKKDGQETKAWQWPKANYRRLPEELVVAIRQLHEQHSVPVGEIVTLFLGHALDAYRNGRLILSPQPRVESSLAFAEK